MRLFQLFPFMGLLFAPACLWASDVCLSRPSTAHEIVRCAEDRSPDVQRAMLQLEQAKSRVGVAGQWANPELAVDSLHGTVDSQASSETDIGLSFPIELGGKISARTSVARGGVAQAEAELNQARAGIRAETLLKLHRLRQLLHEAEVTDEAITTFSKLVTQYAKRPKLSPEQEIEVSVYRMVKSSYELKKADIQDQMAALGAFFEITVGLDAMALKNALPESPKTWPEVRETSASSLSPRLALLDAELKSAQAEAELARSESWPTLGIGPSVKLQTEAGRSDQLYGFNLGLALPIFNSNRAARETAAAGVRLAEAKTRLGRLEEKKRRAQLLQSYRQSVAILTGTLSHRDIERKHSEAERLFLRGVVPSALIIEAHRTVTELEENRNERELKALEALYGIQTLDGKVQEIGQ